MSAWGAQQWVKLVKETTYGVPQASPLAGDILYIPLLENAYSAEGAPQIRTLTFAPDNEQGQQWATRVAFASTLRLPMYPSQAPAILNYLFPTGSGSAKALPSFTAWHWDGFEVRRSIGSRMSQVELTSETDTEELMGAFAFTSKDQDTAAFTQPADSLYPYSVRPYVHSDTSGQVTIGSQIDGITSVRLTIQNTLHSAFNNSTRIDRLNYRGRRASAVVRLSNEGTANRTKFEAQTAYASLIFGWLVGGNSLVFNLQGNSKLSGRSVDRAFGSDQYESLTVTSSKDGTSGNLLTFVGT